jgi:antitoxin HicB
MSESKDKRSLAELESLDDFLKEEGVHGELLARAAKRVIAMQLAIAMRERKLTKSAMADLMQTSRAQLDRVLDPNEFNVTLDTLARAANVVGRHLRVDLA